MIRRSLHAVLVFLVALCSVDGVDARADVPNVRASRYDVTLDLQPDGSMDVVEQITLAVGSKAITWFERTVPGRHTDGLTNVVALVDGQEASPLQDGVGVRIRQRGAGLSDGRIPNLEVRWQFAPTTNRTRTFELRYRAVHVVPRETAGPRLLWHALPTDRSYPIDVARVTLRAPAATLAVAMLAAGADAQPATSWREGWLVSRSDVRAKDGITLDVTFSPDTYRPVEPEWAVIAEHAQRLAPAFLAAGLTLLVIGAGTIVMIAVRTWRRIDPAEFANHPAEEGDVPPAVASALMNRGRSSWLSLQAAFFRLVRDGHVIVEKTGEGRWGQGATFTVRLGTAGSSAGHERWIVDGVAGESGTSDLRRLMTQFMRRQKGFHAALGEAMRAEGYLDADRLSTSRGLVVAGLVLLLLALVTAGVLAVFFADRLGPALLAIPGGVFVDGLAFMIAGQALSHLSEAGERAAARWNVRKGLLRDVIKTKGAGASLRDFECWLPVAIGAGMGGRWLRTFDAQLRASGADISWLRAMGSPDDALASITMMVAISGASHGGGAGGGAGAGGGSSSAG